MKTMPNLKSSEFNEKGTNLFEGWYGRLPFFLILRQKGFQERFLQILLLVCIATYLIYPGVLPFIGVSLHGLILGLGFLFHLFFLFPKLPFRYAVPFVLFGCGFATAGVWSFQQVQFMENVKPVFVGIMASYLIGMYFRNSQAFQLLCYLGLFVIVPLAAFSILQTFLGCVGGIGEIVIQDKGFLILRSIESPVVYGLSWLMGIAVLLYGIENNLLVKKAWLLIIPLFLVIILTPSRAVWFGLIVFMIVYFGTKTRFLPLLILLGVFLVFAGTIPRIANALHNDTCETVTKGIKDIGAKTTLKKLVQDSGMHGRWGIVETAIKMWLANPVIGVGPGNFPLYSAVYAPSEQQDVKTRHERQFAPHNVFFALLSETGLVGVVGFIVMLGMVLGRFHKQYVQVSTGGRSIMLVCLALFSSIMTVGLAHDLLDDRIWWIGFGLLIGSTYYSDQS